MSKSKLKRGGPPLFELLQGNRFRRGDAGPPPNLRVVHHESESGDEGPSGTPSSMRIADSAEPGDARDAKNTAMQIKGDRLELSLTPFTAAVGAFVILLLVLGVYIVGRSRGEKAGVLRGVSEIASAGALEGIDGVETARQQPPASHLVESLFEPNAKANGNPNANARPNREMERIAGAPVRPAEGRATSKPAVDAKIPPGPQQGWARDYTYIVAQEFAAGRTEDARRAQEYLTSKGFAAQVVKLSGGALQLITLEGYNHKDPAQKQKADEILKKQRAVGAEYFASGGGYKLEGYYKTLKKDQW